MNKFDLKGRLGKVLLGDKSRFRTIVEWDTENFYDFVSFMVASEYSSFEIYDTIKYEIFIRSGYCTFKFFNKELFEKMFRTSVDTIHSERKYFEVLNLCGVEGDEINTLDIKYNLAVRVDSSKSFVLINENIEQSITELCTACTDIYKILKYLLFYMNEVSSMQFGELLDVVEDRVLKDSIELPNKVEIVFLMETIICGVISIDLYTHYLVNDPEIFSIIALAQSKGLINLEEVLCEMF